MSVAKGASGVRTGDRLARGVAGTGQRSSERRSRGGSRAMLRRMLRTSRRARRLVRDRHRRRRAGHHQRFRQAGDGSGARDVALHRVGRVAARHGVRWRRKVKQGREMFVVRRFQGLPPGQRIEIVSARRSGEDVADELRKQQKFGSETQKFRSPFHPDYPSALHVLPRGRARHRAGPAELPPDLHRTGETRALRGERASRPKHRKTPRVDGEPGESPTFVNKAEVPRPVRRAGRAARRALRGHRRDRGRAPLLQAAWPDGLPLQRLQLPRVDACRRPRPWSPTLAAPPPVPPPDPGPTGTTERGRSSGGPLATAARRGGLHPCDLPPRRDD